MAGLPGSFGASFTGPRLTYPSPQDPDQASLQPEESESDILPFAIDGDTGSPFDVAPLTVDTESGTYLPAMLQHACLVLEATERTVANCDKQLSALHENTLSTS